MREELRPCPFCGEVPKGLTKQGGSDERYGYNFSMIIECSCGVRLSRPSKQGVNGWCCDQGEAENAVIEAWNRRVPKKGEPCQTC